MHFGIDVGTCLGIDVEGHGVKPWRGVEDLSFWNVVGELQEIFDGDVDGAEVAIVRGTVDVVGAVGGGVVLVNRGDFECGGDCGVGGRCCLGS